MRYTIITPTICRPSLLRLCASIDAQTQEGWEHLVRIDAPGTSTTKDQQRTLASIPPNANRVFSFCDRNHKNYGHTCRHQAWEQAKGDYILYVDDDDYLADKDVLSTLDVVTEPWAVFPALRHGKPFLKLPPGTHNTGTGMFVHKREIGRWPDSSSYEADGIFVEGLREKFPFQVVQSRPLVIQPTSSFGIFNAESWLGGKLATLTRSRLQLLDYIKTRLS